MFSKDQTAIVCGANRGIGIAVVEELLRRDYQRVVATHRAQSDTQDLKKLSEQYPDQLDIRTLNIDEESDYSDLAQYVRDQDLELGLLLNCIGVLHYEDMYPEKKIDEFSGANMIKSLAVNSIPTGFLAKHLKENIRRSKNCVFAVFSAQVASITENEVGGWYSYRSSKAALNMLVKNVSVEFSRLSDAFAAVVLDPGTTETRLSRPFLDSAKKQNAVYQPNETASRILDVIEQLTPQDNGKFLSWDSKEIPW